MIQPYYDAMWSDFDLNQYNGIQCSTMRWNKYETMHRDTNAILYPMHAFFNWCIASFIFKFLWLSGRALRQLRKRLLVQFPGNTHTNENV